MKQQRIQIQRLGRLSLRNVQCNPKSPTFWTCACSLVDHAPLLIEQKDTLMQRSTKLRANMLLATCAVFAQKLLLKWIQAALFIHALDRA